MGVLYLVPTPIGNYDDMTLRGVEVLNSCDFVYSEDILESKKLLDYYNVERLLDCYKEKIDEILKLLHDGKTIALISKSGYAGVDLESNRILKEAVARGNDVITIPGANYLLTGLVTSGIPCDKFLYCGFLEQDRKKEELDKLIDFDRTLVFYEYQDNLNDTLQNLASTFGKRMAVLCLNISKENERFIHFNLGDELEDIETDDKIVIVVEGAKIKSAIQRLNDMDIVSHYNVYISQGLDSKEAMKKVAKDRGVSKSDIYRVINK